jgi:hypothetical protein
MKDGLTITGVKAVIKGNPDMSLQDVRADLDGDDRAFGDVTAWVVGN